MKKSIGVLLVAGAALMFAKEHEAVLRIDEAARAFDEIMAAKDKGIPANILEHAKCVVIVPGVKRAGFIIGGEFGKGEMACRTGNGFTGPSTVRVEGGSVGAQIGAGETDLILVVMNDAGARKLMHDEFKIGGDAAAMAGPIGRAAEADTDAMMRAEILSYSRARGAFAGITLKGTTLRVDAKDNEEIYGKPVHHEDILMGRVPPPAVARKFDATLNRYFRANPADGKPLTR